MKSIQLSRRAVVKRINSKLFPNRVIRSTRMGDDSYHLINRNNGEIERTAFLHRLAAEFEVLHKWEWF